ncbi:MAG: cytochrome c [Proteobacteria bacterium]|nr:cytochrome c [Pseudomonadota bacterium]
MSSNIADAPQTPLPVTKIAASPASDFPAYTDASSEVAEGARLFGYKRCAECHSDAGIMLGAGNGNIDTIATAIRDGRPGGMPAYSGKLTDAQIWQIAAFVKALDTQRDGETMHVDVDLTAAN